VPKLVLFNKPYHVLSQFTDEAGRQTLSNFINIKGVYPAGRLDYDSEGLLLLTDDGRLQSLISQPKHKLTKTYWAQVEGQAEQHHCDALIEGVELKDGPASAISCSRINPVIWDRVPPIRVRKTVADSWIELTINQGRNRQVRRMTAAVGLPTLRLVRPQIGRLRVDDLSLGQIKVFNGDSATELFNRLLKDQNSYAR